MTETELLELAAKIEAATGPDISLDMEISDATGVWQRLPTWKEFRPTESLDAAMQLVPAGEFLNVDGPRKYLNIPTPVPNVWRACIGFAPTHIGWGETPALALCSASLKAIASIGGNHG
jgi:hypothetical protein